MKNPSSSQKALLVAFSALTMAAAGILCAPVLGAESAGLVAQVIDVHHLIYDPIDNAYYCVGSPVDCLTFT